MQIKTIARVVSDISSKIHANFVREAQIRNIAKIIVQVITSTVAWECVLVVP